MSKEQLKREIIQKILEMEKRNIYSGYQKNKEQMIAEIENVIVSEVDRYEDRKNQA